MRGKFITLEGVDGAGKSTHIPYILSLLQARGVEVVPTREPGGTPLGERLREILLQEPMHPETETLLMFAARHEHIVQVIEPALARGAYVLSDRFTDATFAYQCGGRIVPGERVRILEEWVQHGLQPDLTILFDVPVEISTKRLAGARAPDKFEREGAGFFNRIRKAYIARANSYPNRFRVINTDRPMEEVQKSLEEVLLSI
ncbi:MAG TPA: dTMP kinase [Methylophilaceae bacterium]|nr:dTMP kinase [Methylophilaceae bacterium]